MFNTLVCIIIEYITPMFNTLLCIISVQYTTLQISVQFGGAITTGTHDFLAVGEGVGGGVDGCHLGGKEGVRLVH